MTGSTSLRTTSAEHHARIQMHVDRLPVLADEMGKVGIDAFIADFEAECAFISTQLMPHMEAIETSLYVELERLMAHRHSMDPMREEHARLRDLFGSLCHYRRSIERGEFEPDDEVALRRVLYRLYGLLKVHLAEEEMYLTVVDREVSDLDKEVLTRALDHAGSQPL